MSKRSANIFRLPNVPGLRGAAELKDGLLNALDGYPTIEIDASDAEDIDIATLQLLIATQKTAGQLGKSVAIVPSGNLQAALVRCGLASPDDNSARALLSLAE